MALHRDIFGGIGKYRGLEQRPPGMGESVGRVPDGDRGGVSRGPVARLEVYSEDSPEDYVPDVGFTGIQGIGYEPYEVVFDQAPPHTAQTTGGLPHGAGDPQIDYSDCPMTQGLFEHLMKEEGLVPVGRPDIAPISEAPAGPGPMPADSGLEEVVRGAGPVAGSGPSLVVEGGRYDHFDQLPASDLTSAPGNYAAVEPQDFFEQRRQILDNGFGPFEALPIDRGAPIEPVFLDQVVLSDPSQQMPLHMGLGFGPDMPPAP